MKAAVFNGPGEISIEERPLPRPGPGEAVVRVEYCGICGSDIHAFRTGMYPPGLVIGHEFAGVVTEVGDPAAGCGAGALPVTGTRVTGNSVLGCGVCPQCTTGRANLCDGGLVLGVTVDGAMAEYAVAPLTSLVELPEGLSLRLAALAEPYSIAVHAVRLSGLVPGDAVVVQGAGPIGLCVAQVARIAGATRVIVTETRPSRAAVAARLGADQVIDPSTVNPFSRVDELTGGRGADVAFECVGIPETVQQAGGLVRKGGTVVLAGIADLPVEMDFLGLINREVRIVTAFCNAADDFARAVRLLAGGAVAAEPLITREIPLAGVVDAGFLPLLDPNCPDVKVLVRP